MDMNKLIYVRDQVLETDFCQHVIEKFDWDTRRYPGMVSNSSRSSQRVDLTYKNSEDLRITNLEGWEKEDSIMCESFSTHFQNYFTEMSTLGNTGISIGKYHDLGFAIRKYEVNQGYYNWHNDFALNSQDGLRLLTFVWYLNDVIKGGETEFINGKLIRPYVGRLLIFPTSWYFVHKGNYPLSGNKYIITACLYGRNW